MEDKMLREQRAALTFRMLRGANCARLPLFKNGKGERAHSKPDGSDWSNAQWLQALVGEVGELANLMKKIDRRDFEQRRVQYDLESELADIMIYLDLLAMRLGVDLDSAVIAKFNAVSNRVCVGVRLTNQGWYCDKHLGEVPGEDVPLERRKPNRPITDL